MISYLTGYNLEGLSIHSLCLFVQFVVVTIITILVIRLSVCLPMFSSTPSSDKKNKKKKSSYRTMVIWGSGGHTTEMILLLQKLSSAKFNPIHSILAVVSLDQCQMSFNLTLLYLIQTDKTTIEKIQASNVSVYIYYR